MLHFRFNLLYHPQSIISYLFVPRFNPNFNPPTCSNRSQFYPNQASLRTSSEIQISSDLCAPLFLSSSAYHVRHTATNRQQLLNPSCIIHAGYTRHGLNSFLQSSIPICYRWKYLFSPWISLIRDGRRSVVYIIIKIIIRVGRHGAQAIVIDVEHKLDTCRFPWATSIPPFSTTSHPNRPSISPRDR